MNTQCFHFLNLLKIEPQVLPMYLSLKLRTCDARERVERWTCRARRYSCSVQKLCHALEDILEDTFLEASAEKYLLTSFPPRLEVNEGGIENEA